ncbi:uncharacterized protein JCM6883_005517 [Sporobolomyces salmoneus]|uniref:uncharacterized protein n=1 Tax=Sporobolomyces salmoneus TaxID=183962 RepID=UPI00317CC832
MTSTAIGGDSHGLASNNPFRDQTSAGTGDDFAPNDIVQDLLADTRPDSEEEPENELTVDGNPEPVETERPRRPGMYERHRSSSAPSVNSSSSGSRQFRIARKPPPPPPRPIFPPANDDDNIPAYEPRERLRREQSREKNGKETSRADLERQEKILLQKAIEESKQDSARRSTKKSDEDDQLRRALEASRREAKAARSSPPISLRESAELERALALSTEEHESRLPRSSNTPSPSKVRQSSSRASTPSRSANRSRSASNPEALPPFPFTEQDLVRPSYPAEKSHLFPQGRPSLPPGAGTTQDEYEKEMEMLTLAIRMSEEEERLRQEREDRELREVVRRVEEKENAANLALARRNSPPSSSESASPTNSPKQSRRSSSSWFRPPLASKYSATSSPPASPPLSPGSIDRPGLEATPTESTLRSNATSFRSAAESLPFTNLISTTAVPNDLSSRIESQRPQRRPPAPPHPSRLPPSPPETPVVSGSTSFAPPIPPLPAPYARQSTIDSDRPGPFLPAHSEAFRHENDGSPVEMPYLTPSAPNSIRSTKRGSTENGGRISSWALDERNGSNNSGGSGSGGSRSESTSGHSRVNSTHRRSTDYATGGTSSNSPPNQSEEGHGDNFESAGEDFRGDDDDHDSVESEVRLAIRNPDSSPAPPLELQHQGGFVSEPPAVDVPRDVEVGDSYLENLEGGPIFSSAYAGRSMSAIDEQTEPASSIVAEDGFSRQGSYPSNDGSLDPTIHRGETERVLEGLQGVGGEDMRTSITYHQRPIDEREWMHDSVLRDPSHPPLTESLTPTPPRRESPPEINVQDPSPSHLRQVTASSAITNSSAGVRLSFPLPPLNSNLPPPASASPVESSLTPTTTAPTPRPETSSEEPSSSSSQQHSQQSPTVAFGDGTRFGHPSICAREPAHVCPHDGLGNQSEVPESIELTALMEEPEPDSAVGLGLNRSSTRRREETGGKSILRDAWAVEARSWSSLLRFLMWYGDTKLVASPRDVALEPTRHCTAAASLEFRPDDEGYTIIRLVVSILAPDDPEAHSHRELTVEHPATSPPAYQGKGKGKSRSYFHSSSAPPQDSSALSNLATFHLPDSVHLPCRLSNLAIQLYTLRHLASIARSTQPVKEGGTSGYQALRELSIALENLTTISQSRQERDASSHQGPSQYRAQSGGGGPVNRSDENERLLTRLRDRLRRLKRGGGGGGNENFYTGTSPQKPNKLVKAPPTRRDTGPQGRETYPAPTQTVQPLSRTERVLSANDHEHDEEGEEEEELASGSGNHLELDGARFSLVRREPTVERRAGIPEEWDQRRRNGADVRNETSYMPILRS